MDNRQSNKMLALYCGELQAIKDIYDVPDFMMKKVNQRKSFFTEQWYMDKEEEIGVAIYRAMRKINNLMEEIQGIRGKRKRVQGGSFADTVDKYVTKATSALRHRFCIHEGAGLDVQAFSAMRYQVGEYGFDGECDEFKEHGFAYRVKELRTVWHRGKKVPNIRIDFIATPSAVNSVKDAWFYFKSKGVSLFTVKAEEICGHAFNDQGVTVYRIKCLEHVDHDIRLADWYLCESPSMLDGDGNALFGHGKDSATALSLLNRRIKSETLKRLDF